ncbi:MAG: hypothetical protein U0350_36500 [Caldilineaceae bacterium]
MNKHYQTIIAKIERLDSAPCYRFARRLLDLAKHGHLKVEMPCLTDIYGGSLTSTRRALNEMQRASIIYYRLIDDAVCLIDFVDCPALSVWQHTRAAIQTTPIEEEKVTLDDKKIAPDNQKNRVQDVIFSRGDEHSGDDGIGMVLVGRYDQYLNPDQDQDLPIPTYQYHTNTAVTSARANGYHAATLEIEPHTPFQRTALSPSCDAPLSVADDAERIVALLTDEDIGVTVANARRVSRMHTLAFVVKQVATWWDNSALGPGALFKNRLLNAKQYPPGAFSEAFQASECYDRHYPLRGEARERWRLWVQHRDHIEHMAGLENLVDWVNALPPALRRTLEQLPVPTGGDA